MVFSTVYLCIIAVLLDSFHASHAFQTVRTRPQAKVLLHERATSSEISQNETGIAKTLEPDQLNFMMGYLNQNHASTLKKFAQALSPLGTEMAKANARSGGSFVMESVSITDMNTQSATMSVLVNRRNKPTPTKELVEFSLNANPIPERARRYTSLPPVPDDENRLPIDDIVRRLNRLCWIVSDAKVTGKLIQLATQLGGAEIGKLPENMYLNQVPHNRYVRQYFYNQTTNAVRDAVVLCSQGKMTNRMQVVAEFPEMNPEMDSYRIGTLLEMARTICIRLAEENVRVRLCVQGSMGVGIFTGVPKQLSGVSKLMQMMDWQSGEGEENEGMTGNFVNFGAVGKEHVTNERRNEDGEIIQHQDDVFLLIAPQSMLGSDSSIFPLLEGMVQEAGDRPVILLNPDLTDKMSAAGQQNVRGRQGRMDFANSFETVYHFQNLYVSGTSYFPILGTMTKPHPTSPWVAHQRRDYADGGGEIYLPMISSETRPEGEAIMETFDM